MKKRMKNRMKKHIKKRMEKRMGPLKSNPRPGCLMPILYLNFIREGSLLRLPLFHLFHIFHLFHLFHLFNFFNHGTPLSSVAALYHYLVHNLY